MTTSIEPVRAEKSPDIGRLAITAVLIPLWMTFVAIVALGVFVLVERYAGLAVARWQLVAGVCFAVSFLLTMPLARALYNGGWPISAWKVCLGWLIVQVVASLVTAFVVHANAVSYTQALSIMSGITLASRLATFKVRVPAI